MTHKELVKKLLEHYKLLWVDKTGAENKLAEVMLKNVIADAYLGGLNRAEEVLKTTCNSPTEPKQN